MPIYLPARYRKSFGIFRDPRLRAEIAKLDAEHDCQRIVHLLTCYEFSFDIKRALEMALFHTYGSASISRLLDKTGEFRNHGQKRYDDTRLLIAHFLEDGYDGEFGRRAIERMNAIHGRMPIRNEEFLFVLSTFISYPIDWLSRYGYRPMTPHEQHAWFVFFRNVGLSMKIKDIPETWPALRRWVDGYEADNLTYAESNRKVANATVAIFEGWFPHPLKAAVEPAVRSLIDERLLRAFGYQRPSALFAGLVRTVLWLRKQAKRVIHLETYPKLLAFTFNRTYPGNTYTIEGIKPSYLKDRL